MKSLIAGALGLVLFALALTGAAAALPPLAQNKPINDQLFAAAVGDLHRILLTGGVFLYPADARPRYAAGHIRLLYEAVPIALLMQQAGGAATDGTTPILARVPTGHHEKTPLVFGAADEVARIATYLSD